MLAVVKVFNRKKAAKGCWPRVWRSGLLSFMLFLPALALADGEGSSVVDQLEQQLLKEERASIPFKEESLPAVELIPRNAQAAGSYRGHIALEGLPPQLDSLKRINKDMGALQADIDQLAAKVANLQQVFREQAQLDNVVALELRTDPREASQLQSLLVKMDGQIIYEMTADAGLWLPEKVIDLYEGPLDPGEHRLDIVARAVMKHPGKIPLQDELYRFLNHSFTIKVPTGAFRKKWSVEVNTPSGEDSNITAKLTEGKLNL